MTVFIFSAPQLIIAEN